MAKDESADNLEILERLLAEGHEREQRLEKRARDLRKAAERPELSVEKLRAAATDAGLTPRELEVWALIVRGKRNAEIAAELGAATETVRKHVRQVLAKLGVENRASAAVTAMEVLRRGKRNARDGADN